MKNKSVRGIPLLLLVLLIFLAAPFQASAAEIIETGECGDNATYTLYDDGKLIIEGTGAIAKDKFYGREDISDVVILDGITYISRYAFASSSLKTIDIPNSVTGIASYAFTGCADLQEITIPDSVTDIADYAFYECDSLEKVTIGKSIRSISQFPFYCCDNISELNLSEGLTEIGEYAFSYKKLKSLIIPDSVTSIGDSAFSGNPELETVTLSKNLTSIGDGAFYNCTKLGSIVIPESVVTIESMAFSGCSGLKSITIGQAAASVDYTVFSDCTSVEKIVFTEGCTEIGDSLCYGFGITSVTIPDSVTTIGDSAFQYCTKLEQVTIPDSVTYIGNTAFADNTSLKTVDIGSGVTHIGSGAFHSCSLLTEIRIPDGVTTLESNVLAECSSLERLYLGKDISYIDYTNGKDNLEIILKDGMTEIPDSLLSGLSYASIVIPGSVEKIEDYAFASCFKLKNVDFGDGIKEIGDYAFQSCTSLTELTLPDSLQSIGDYAFQYSALEHIDLGNSVTVIGMAAFDNCRALKEIIIPDSVVSLNGNRPVDSNLCIATFGSCENLERITFGKGLTELPACVQFNTAMESLILPENITNIEGYGFSRCQNLSYLEIWGVLEGVNPTTFINDRSLTNVVFRGDAPTAYASFGFCSNEITAVFYPKGNPTWNNASINAAAMIPYTLDAAGNIIPDSPSLADVQEAMTEFKTNNYTSGAAYPDIFYYFINGKFLKGEGSEAFAFELSDACFGFLPISDQRQVVYANLRVGDLLYIGDQVWVIADINSNGVKVHGAQNEKVVYDAVLTKAQVEAADSYRTRYDVSPGPGVPNPYPQLEVAPVPEEAPTEAEAYQRIIALKKDYPEGMPWNFKNCYEMNREPVSVKEPVGLEPLGSGCSAFGYLASDAAFGELRARWIYAEDMSYDDLMVGDNIMDMEHQMVILEIYQNYLVVAEGNYGGKIHWGRILTREEVQGNYEYFTRYPVGTVAPQREYKELPVAFTDVPETAYYAEPVQWAVDLGVTNGYGSADTFAPDLACTRGQIVTFLWRANGSPEPKSSVNPFTDVVESDYFYKAVLWAVENEITAGYGSDTIFNPNGECTRAQVATFLWRAEGEPAPASSNNPFMDVAAGQYYYDAVLWAVEQGVTNGYGSDDVYAPDITCTRGQIVTFLYRAIA